MSGYSVAAHQARLAATFDRTAAISDPQTQADLARHLCVLMSGFIEQAVRHIYGEHIRRNASPRVQRYTERRLATLQNANCKRLVDLTYDFDPAWGAALQDFLVDERRDHVDSVVANKNQIAHGESVGVTYARAKEFFQSIRAVIAFLEQAAR